MTPYLHTLIKSLVLQGHTVNEITKQVVNGPDISVKEAEQEISKIIDNLTPEQSNNINKIKEYLAAVTIIRERVQLQFQISRLLDQMQGAEKRLEELSHVKTNI